MEQTKEKCAFCNSENLEFLDPSIIINKNYLKVQIRDNIAETETANYILYASKYLCLDCGKIFEIVSKKKINEYKEMKEYFK